MRAPLPFFDGHNDFLLRLQKSPQQREALWLGSTGTGHLDLQRMKQGGFAGGLFAIYVPSPSTGLNYMAQMERAPFEVPLPELMTHEAAQPVALAMAGLLHWMERAASDDFAVCRSAAEVRAMIGSGKIAGVMHMEGAEAIGNRSRRALSLPRHGPALARAGLEPSNGLRPWRAVQLPRYSGHGTWPHRGGQGPGPPLQ